MPWTRKKENWLFLFAVLGAIAALTKILEYFNITPFKPAAGGPMPSVAATAVAPEMWWALGFVGFSIVLSATGLYFSNRRTRVLTEMNTQLQQKYEQAIQSSAAWENRCDEKHRQLDKLAARQASLQKRPWGTLTIHSAQWIPKGHGSPMPVEAAIRAHIAEGLIDTVNLKLTNDNLGGDPEKYTRKVMKLSYSYGDSKPIEIVKEEYEWLVLPEIHNIASAEPSASKLKIHSALYGSGPKTDKSVVSEIESRIVAGRFSELVGPELFGDPAEGDPKRIIVEYSVNGGPIIKTERPQSKRLTIPEDPWLLSQIESMATNAPFIPPGPQLIVDYAAVLAHRGLRITNHGEPAFGIQVSPISNGRQIATFDEIDKVLKDVPHDLLIPSVKKVNPADNFTDGNFLDALSESPIPFTVSYRDYFNNRGVLRYEIEKPRFADEVVVRYLGPV